MMTVTECPSIERLKDLTLGRLAEEDSDVLLDHLRDCEGCQSELDTIGDGEDSLIHAIRSPDNTDGLAGEPECQVAVIAALGAIGGRTQSPAITETPAFPVAIGEYEIVRPLGRGGMGNVYLARHTKLGRLVAIKVLASHRLGDAKMKERFEAEMRAVGRLSHPGIVTAHDAREIDGTAVLVTEFIDGMDLAELVARSGPIAIANACELVRQVAVALQYTSDQGFVHRDIKPSNIMLGSSGEVKLLDLGLARLQEPVHQPSELTGTGQAMGTADYIAPEQVTDSRSVDVRADIYALGCTLFKLLTGTAPFAGPEHATAFAKMTAHVSSPPPLVSDFLPDAPTGVVKLVAKMMAKDPASRPQTAMQVAEKLRPFSKDADLSELISHAETLAPGRVTSGESTARSKSKTQPWLRRTVPIAAAIAAGFLGLFIGLMGGFLIRIKAPDGSVVTLNAPEGSDISITPRAIDGPTEPTLSTALVNPPDTTFLKFAILATVEESKQHTAVFGGPPDVAPNNESMRWYPVDSDVTVQQNYEKNGQSFHLVSDADSLTLANDKLRDQIEMAQAKGTDQIQLCLSESSGNALRELTRNHLKRQLAIIVNGKIRMAPTILSEVGRDLVITGKFTKEEIKFLMDSLNSGLVQPLSKPTEPIQMKTDLQRLQGVWRIVGGPSQRLFAFDGSAFFVSTDQSIRAAGHMTVTSTDEQPLEVRLQSFLHSGPIGEEKLSGRFLTDSQMELLLKVPFADPTPPGFAPSHKTESVSVFERIGDMPSSMQQVQALLASPTLSKLNDQQSRVLHSSLLMVMQAKQMGLVGFVEASNKAWAADFTVKATNQLKQIALAFHNFNTAYRKFPASASTTREGSRGVNASELQPFSWRVAILPFIDEVELFEQYRFDEPWDSEANSKLLSRMPELYRSPTATADQPVGHANYQGIADGTGAIGLEDGFRMHDILDGLSNTLLVMETESSVPWTKPQDLSEVPEFADDAVLRYALADGSVRTMDPVDIEKLKAMITRDGGETVQP